MDAFMKGIIYKNKSKENIFNILLNYLLLRSGNGKFIYSDGSIYKGEWRND